MVEFDTYEKMAEYINAELDAGRTMKDIENNDFNVNERVIAKRLRRRGYVKKGNKYVLQEDTKTSDDKVNQVVIKADKVLKTRQDDKKNQLVINDKNVMDKVLGLVSNYDKIMELLSRNDKVYDKMYDGIIIELPESEEYRTTIRINKVIYEQFDEFCNENKTFTKKDLLSMALKEYMNKYKKNNAE